MQSFPQSVCLPAVRKNTECLGTKGHWTLPHPYPQAGDRDTFQHEPEINAQIFLQHVQWASVVNNQLEVQECLGSWPRPNSRFQQEATISQAS